MGSTHRLHNDTRSRAFGGAETAALAIFRIDKIKLVRIVFDFDYCHIRAEDKTVVARRTCTT